MTSFISKSLGNLWCLWTPWTLPANSLTGGRPSILTASNWLWSINCTFVHSFANNCRRFTFICNRMGFDWSFALMRYGQRWRRHRRTFHQYFHPTASIAYHDIQYKHTRLVDPLSLDIWKTSYINRDMIRSLHKSPNDFITHIRHHVGATIVDVRTVLLLCTSSNCNIRLFMASKYFRKMILTLTSRRRHCYR